MLTTILPVSAAAALMAFGFPAAAQPQAPTTGGAPPTPGEQASMHQGDPATHGSSTIIRDESGTHLDGYPHMAVARDASGTPSPVRKHHRHHHYAR